MGLEERLDRAVAGAIERGNIVGAVTLVRRGGTLIYESARGLRDREAGKAMTVDTIFRLSSLTKPIVATTILAMVDAGLIGLDDAVGDYLPYFRPAMPDGRVPTITIRQLLTHTAGLSGMPELSEAEKQDPRYLAVGLDTAHLSLDDNIERLNRVPLLFAPGTGWHYSPAIDVLGAVAGKLVSGTLGDAVEKYVTGPLRMKDTRFGVTDTARLAAAYGDGAAGPELMGNPHSVTAPWGGITTYRPNRIFDAGAYHAGGGGMAGTARDFMALLEMLRAGGGEILKPETVAAGFANQIPQLAQSTAAGWHFGFFGAVLTDAGVTRSPQSLGTVRWGGIYGHSWFIDPVAKLTVVAMTNTGLEGSDGPYPFQIRDAIYAQG